MASSKTPSLTKLKVRRSMVTQYKICINEEFGTSNSGLNVQENVQ